MVGGTKLAVPSWVIRARVSLADERDPSFVWSFRFANNNGEHSARALSNVVMNPLLIIYTNNERFVSLGFSLRHARAQCNAIIIISTRASASVRIIAATVRGDRLKTGPPKRKPTSPWARTWRRILYDEFWNLLRSNRIKWPDGIFRTHEICARWFQHKPNYGNIIIIDMPSGLFRISNTTNHSLRNAISVKIMNWKLVRTIVIHRVVNIISLIFFIIVFLAYFNLENKDKSIIMFKKFECLFCNHFYLWSWVSYLRYSYGKEQKKNIFTASQDIIIIFFFI